jgi:hypothetical protein
MPVSTREANRLLRIPGMKWVVDDEESAIENFKFTHYRNDCSSLFGNTAARVMSQKKRPAGKGGPSGKVKQG